MPVEFAHGKQKRRFRNSVKGLQRWLCACYHESMTGDFQLGSLAEYRCLCERRGASRRLLQANYLRLAVC